MPPIAEFVPVRAETVDTIRARIDANVNAGLDPADPRWQDTVAGHWWSDHMQSFSLELEGVYDYVSLELAASFFLPFTWGIYLDYWGEMLDVPRNPPAAASGPVRFGNASDSDVLVGAGAEVAVPAATTEDDPLVFVVQTSGSVPAGGTLDAAAVASEAGSAYSVAAGAVSLITSPGLNALTVTNPAAMTGGADEELDEPYKARLLLEFTGARGGGTIDDYIAETLRAFPEVGNVTVQAAWAGPNTVRLILTDHAAQPMSALVIAAVQSYWDQNAPIDADVTVATVEVIGIAVHADLETDEGYTLDGTSGTQPIRDALNDALTEFFHSLPAGHDVLINRVMQALLGVRGVYNVTGVTLDYGVGPIAADVPIEDLQSAQLSGLGDYTETLPVSV